MTHEDDELAEILDRTLRAGEVIAMRATWETGNRRALLWVHSCIGLIAGVQIILFGAAPNIENLMGVWTRPALGVMGLLGGGILASGLAARPRSIPREVVGLFIMGIWDFCIMLAIIAARLQYGDFHARPLLQPQPPGYVVPYAIAVYGGLFAMICVHLSTLRKLRGK